VTFDVAQLTQMYGPPSDPEDASTADATWDVGAMNEARGALEALGFPSGRVLGDFIEAEREMRRTSWSEEGGRRALVEAHGPSQAQAMIDAAQVVVELINEHPVGQRHVARWEREGGLNSPHLVEALSRMMDSAPRGHDGWIGLNLKRAQRWAAQRRGRRAA
jgi:hypothetical protein